MRRTASHVVTLALVRQVLSRYVSILHADWRFAPTPFGRPRVANAQRSVAGLCFNLSHSGLVVVLALTRGRQLGVDVEDVQRRWIFWR